MLSLPQSCFPLTVAFLHREKVLLFTSGGRFVFRHGKQLFSVATPGAAPLEQRRRPRAEARDQASRYPGGRTARAAAAPPGGGARPSKGTHPPGFTSVGFGFTSVFLTRTTACSYCFGEYRSRGIAKCPDVQEPEELSGCLWFSAVCHVRSIFVSNDISYGKSGVNPDT